MKRDVIAEAVAKQEAPLFTSTMNAPSSLCPGYKQVEAFGPEEEYEDDEEVTYVVLDLGNAEPTLVPTSSTYRLIVSSIFLRGRLSLNAS